jgi:hypothetical protein
MAITFIPSITVKTDATYRTVQTFEDLLQDINVRFGEDHDMVITKISTREEYSNSSVETYSVVGMVGRIKPDDSFHLLCGYIGIKPAPFAKRFAQESFKLTGLPSRIVTFNNHANTVPILLYAKFFIFRLMNVEQVNHCINAPRLF